MRKIILSFKVTVYQLSFSQKDVAIRNHAGGVRDHIENEGQGQGRKEMRKDVIVDGEVRASKNFFVE